MKIKNILLITSLAVGLLGCSKGEFDDDGYKILSLKDKSFHSLMISQHDYHPQDGKLSIWEAANGQRTAYGYMTDVIVIDCDNSEGEFTKIRNISDINYFSTAEVLLFQNNRISGEVNLLKFENLLEIDFTGNQITKIILDGRLREIVTVRCDEGTEVSFVGGSEEEDPDPENPEGGEE